MLAIFPLAFPIIAGPGTLAVTIISAQQSGTVMMSIVAITASLFVFCIARYANRLMRIIGPHAGMIIPRLLYILLAAKAVALVLEGITTFLNQNL